MVKRTLVDVVKRHEAMLGNIYQALADHVEGLIQVLPVCSACEKRPMTVVNVLTQETRCDSCCARFVHDANILQQMISSDVPLDRALERWVDLPYADAVRRIEAHYDNMTEFDVLVH